MRLVADDEPVADRDPGGRELVDLGEQRLRIDDDAVADDEGDPRVEDSRRQQPQHELPPVRVHRVARVVAALVARDDGKVRGQEVDNLALALVAPLRAQHRYVHIYPGGFAPPDPPARSLAGTPRSPRRSRGSLTLFVRRVFTPE